MNLPNYRSEKGNEKYAQEKLSGFWYRQKRTRMLCPLKGIDYPAGQGERMVGAKSEFYYSVKKSNS